MRRGRTRKSAVPGWLHWRVDNTPFGIVVRAFAVAWAAIWFTLIFPALVAAAGNVFYASSMSARLHAAEQARVGQFNRVQAARRKTVERLDGVINDELTKAQQEPRTLMLFQVRDQVAKDLASATPPIAVIPFYLSQQMLLWPAIYTCLCWIAIVLKPSRDLGFWRVIRSRKTIELGVATYLFYEWPLWLRNFTLSNEQRVIFAYSNHDIHWGSFIAQEIIVCGFCVLLAVIWRQWFAYLLRVRHDDPAEQDTEAHFAVITSSTAAASFANVFFEWAACSALLALGFVGFTAFFWDLVAKLHDQRYLLSAILAHVLWGITWIVLTLPLINEWRLWNRCRTYALQAVASMGNSEEACRKATLIKDIQPVAPTTLTVANVISIVSFVSPIVHAFVS